MLTRLTIELERSELAVFRDALSKLTVNQPTVEIKLTTELRAVCRQILKEIERWEDFKKERW